MKTCECGAPISLRATRCRRCTARLAQARYRNSEKGKAHAAIYRRSDKRRALQARYWNSEKGKATFRLIQARYNSSEKGKATIARYRNSNKCKAKLARYRATEKGIATMKADSARRLYFGGVYRGKAQTVEQAVAIRAYVKERLREFIAGQQARAETEGASSGTVSTETKP